MTQVRSEKFTKQPSCLPLTIIPCEDCALKVLAEGTGPNLVGGCQLNAVQHSWLKVHCYEHGGVAFSVGSSAALQRARVIICYCLHWPVHNCVIGNDAIWWIRC